MTRLTARNIEMADEATIEVMRNLTVAQKLALFDSLGRSAVARTRMAIIHQHPEWDAEQVRVELGRRIRGEYGRERQLSQG